jgi:hypothetical protein
LKRAIRERDVDVAKRDSALAEKEAEVVRHKRAHADLLSRRDGEHTEELRMLRRARDLAEKTARNLHEENQRVEAEYLEGINQLRTTVDTKDADLRRVTLEHEERLAAEAAK